MKVEERQACLSATGPRPDLRPVQGAEADAELARLAKALGHPARVQIVRLLAQQDQCVCGTIVDGVGLAQSTVSQHLKVLKDADIIQGEVEGVRVCYCLNPATLRRLKALVGGL
jgi:DNA-binding transcriptional ArsR family regulator